MANALIVRILGDARGFARELDRAAGKTRQFSRAAGVAGLAIAGGLAYGLEKSVKAASEAQQAQARLDQAFKRSGLSSQAFAGQVEKAAASARNLGFDDEEAKDALGSLVIATHNGRKAFQDLSIAEDIARFKHVDLTAASKMLTMAMAGSQRATKQLGLSIQPVTTAVDKVNAKFKEHSGAAYEAALATAKLQDKQSTAARVIDLVSTKLRGQADAFSQTAAGGAARFRAQLEEVEENIGKGLLPILTSLVGALADVAGWFVKHTTATKVLVVALASLAATLLSVSIATKAWAAAMAVAKTAQFIYIAATEGMTAATVAFDIALAPVILTVGAVVVALAALGVGLYIAWKKSETFRNIVKGAFDAVKVAASTFVDFFTHTLPGAFERVGSMIHDAFQRLWDWLKTSALQAALIVLEPFSHLPGKLGQWARDAKDGVNAELNKISTAQSEARLEKFREHLIDLGRTKTNAKVDVLFKFGKLPPGLEPLPGPGSTGEGLATATKVAAQRYLDRHPVFAKAAGGAGAKGLSPAVGPELALAQGMGLHLTSGYRPGAVTATGQPSLHSVGKAIDVADGAAQMASFARRVIGMPNIREVLYSPLGGWYGNGWVPLSGALRSEHFSHVHVGVMGEGGIVTRPTIAMIGERGPEAVIPLDRHRGGGDIHIHFEGPVFGDKRQVAREIRDELVRIGRLEPNIFAGFA